MLNFLDSFAPTYPGYQRPRRAEKERKKKMEGLLFAASGNQGTPHFSGKTF